MLTYSLEWEVEFKSKLFYYLKFLQISEMYIDVFIFIARGYSCIEHSL